MEKTDGNDYYPFTTEGQIIRWRQNQQIRVLLPSDASQSGVTGYSSSFRTAFITGTSEWLTTLQKYNISISYITSGNNDIEVIWVDGTGLAPGVGGVAAFSTQTNPSRKITMTTQNNLTGNSVHSADTIKLIAMHEFGHLLGLRHSFDEEDMMYPQLLGQSTLSGRDTATLDHLYSLTPDIVLSDFPVNTHARMLDQSSSFTFTGEVFYCGFGTNSQKP